MSRILKFRVWDKIKTEMLYDALVQVAVESSLLSDEQNVVRAFPFDGIESGEFLYGNALESVEVMQAIGLRDKHGKEIFEGDIVRGILYWPDENILPKPEVMQGVVKWIDEWLSFGFDKDQGIVSLHVPEVIGNIYETPELIQQLKTQSI